MNPMIRLIGDALTADPFALTEAARQSRAKSEMCRKRRFSGPSDARRAHQRAGYRIRVYKCEDCHGYHVTNNEKRHRAEGRSAR